MRSVKKILWSCAVLAVVCGCTKLETPPNKNQPSGDGTGVYKVVAHRGGYQECARPDCSISSLKYAIMLRCFASECDIVLTGDNDVLVAHPQSGYLVNGLEPFDHTVAEIRAAGTLANGEPVPTLRDFIRVLQDPELNPHGMRLWLDVKRLTKNGEEIDVNHSINACYRACEIIKEMKAQSLCEFLIPTGGSIFDVVRDKVIDEYRINLAWMTCTHPDNYGKAWAQLSYDKIFGDNTAYGPMDYISAGVQRRRRRDDGCRHSLLSQIEGDLYELSFEIDSETQGAGIRRLTPAVPAANRCGRSGRTDRRHGCARPFGFATG